METCDYDVKIPTQGPLATGPSCGRPALTGYACAVPLALSTHFRLSIPVTGYLCQIKDYLWEIMPLNHATNQCRIKEIVDV